MKRKTKLLLLILFLLLFSVFGGYFFLAVYYRESFSLNTWMNGVYCTGKTVEEVNSELLYDMEAPIITITEIGGQVYLIDLADAGYKIDYEQPLNNYLQNQNPYLWIENLFVSKKRTLAAAVTLQEDVLKQIWMELPFVQSERQKENTVKIQSGPQGYFLYNGLENRLDIDKAYEMLLTAIERGETEIVLEEAGCYDTIPATKEQEALLMLWEKIQAFQNMGIVYDMGDKRIALAGRTAADFLAAENGVPVFDEEGKPVISEDAVKKFIKELAEEYDTYGVERSFLSTRGDTVSIKGGTYGTKLDQKAEVKYLLEKFAENPAKTPLPPEIHIPAYEKKALYRGKNDIGQTYVEIDMSQQKMYYYEEGEKLLETEVVTGNISRRWGTPEGVNYVYNKQKNRVLRGPGYASPVKFWMPVKGGIGIHDANWRSEFGGEIYRKNGSHGCINTPADVMKKLYDMVEIGTPVVMFY